MEMSANKSKTERTVAKGGGEQMELDARKMRILQAIIDDYILTASPVGSRTIAKVRTSAFQAQRYATK